MLIDFCLKNGTRKVIDCNPNETIKDVLPKIIRAFELERYSTIQLIYKGRKIPETDEIKNLNYIQNQIVIVNAQGLKPAESVSSSNVTPTGTPAPPPPPQISPPQQDRPMPAPVPSPSPAPPIQSSLTQRRPPVPLPNPEDWEKNLQFLMEMGFDEDLSVRALVQAYNQPERAVELIANDQVTDPPATPPPQPIATQQPISSTQQTEPRIPLYSYDQSRSSIDTNNDNDDAYSGEVTLPSPQSHPLPEFTYRPINDDNRGSVSQFNPDQFRRHSSDIQILANPLPTDPTIEADEEFDTIRQIVINDPRYIDNIINIIQENIAENDNQNGQQYNIAEQMRENPKLLMHLLGIKKTEVCHVPSTYTQDDINSIRRLYELGNFKWEQVIEAYENGEKNEELAEAFLLSINEYD